MMVNDVINGLKLIADGIESIKKIADAVKSGKDYVTKKHPDVQNDLRLLVDELRKSLSLIKNASGVLTNFRFVVSADNQGLDLVRFNDYFIKSKTEKQYLLDHLDELRTHCSKIREYAGRISGGCGVTWFTELFRMLGLNSPEREKQLAEQLDKLAYEDFAVANSARNMLDYLGSALEDIQNALGNYGMMHPQNVPNAAALLAKYGPEFKKIEEQAEEAVRNLRELAQELLR